MDPMELLFSLPTLCDSSPALEDSAPPGAYHSLHEDDWRQIEFVAAANHVYIQKELAALAAFKSQHRRGSGWTNVYIRQEHPTTIAMVGLRSADMPAFSASALVIQGLEAPSGGTVKGGFALSNDSDWFVYGQRTNDGHIVQLAVSPNGSAPSEQFAQALSRLAATHKLLLIDWYVGSMVDTSSRESVLAWAGRYQRH